MRKDRISIDTLQDMAEKALKEAVREVVLRHRKTGRPLAVWENGKVAYKKVWINKKRPCRRRIPG